MTKINLLPWRELGREQRKREFITMLVMGIVLSGGAVGYWHWYNMGLMENQQARNRYLQQETEEVTKQIKEIKDLEKVKNQLVARMNVVADLQTSRPQAVHLFDELVSINPDGVHLTEVSQKGGEITVLGFAQSNARISAYMRNIESSEWLGSPELQIIEQKAAQDNPGVSSFKLIMQQMVPEQENAK